MFTVHLSYEQTKDLLNPAYTLQELSALFSINSNKKKKRKLTLPKFRNNATRGTCSKVKKY